MFTYTATPLTKDLDAVRVEIGDTVEQGHLVEDEEILYALSKEGEVLGAAARICEQLAVKFASKDQFRVGAAQSIKTSVSGKYLMMAKYLRQQGSGRDGTGTGGFLMPSLSESDKDESRQDTDIPQPAFYRGLHKNPDSADEDTSVLAPSSPGD